MLFGVFEYAEKDNVKHLDNCGCVCEFGELSFTDLDPAFVGPETFGENELGIPVSNRPELRIVDESPDITCGHCCGLEFH
jgi:hypothetical protein